jgi:hypothetical protein
MHGMSAVNLTIFGDHSKEYWHNSRYLEEQGMSMKIANNVIIIMLHAWTISAVIQNNIDTIQGT